jgi:small-conductance mechanosensitive channel
MEIVLENIYIQALLILLLSLGAAKGIDLLFTKGLVRLAARTKTAIDERLITILHHPIFYSIILAGIYVAIARFTLPEKALFYLAGLLKSLALLLWSGAALKVTLLLIQTMERRARGKELIRRRFAPLFENLAKIAVFVIALIILLSIWGIPVTALLASAGLMGLVIGFAARDILANFFGGLFVLADSPYKIGDYIVLDSGEKGIVMDIGLRSTRIKTKDDIEITIPNAQIANSKIINESGPQERTRVRARVGVAYGSDVDKVKEILTRVAEENEHVCAEPKPRVRFREFGDFSLNFELLCWIEDPLNRGLVLDELNTAIYKRFAEEGIEIPFPQHDIYIKQFPKEE